MLCNVWVHMMIVRCIVWAHEKAVLYRMGAWPGLLQSRVCWWCFTAFGLIPPSPSHCWISCAECVKSLYHILKLMRYSNNYKQYVRVWFSHLNNGMMVFVTTDHGSFLPHLPRGSQERNFYCTAHNNWEESSPVSHVISLLILYRNVQKNISFGLI